MTDFPTDWFWIVGKDDSRAWSSGAGAYVTNDPSHNITRIATEQELSGVLRAYGLRGPYTSTNDVRAEAQRRIIALVGASDLTSCLIKQLNLQMRAISNTNKRARGEMLTEAELAEEQSHRDLEAAIPAIRAASNVLGHIPPADYADDKYWP